MSRIVSNVYGKAQMRCYIEMTNYAVAEQTRHGICRNYYHLRDCMLPQIKQSQILLKIFYEDLIPYVKQHSCDQSLKYYNIKTSHKNRDITTTSGIDDKLPNPPDTHSDPATSTLISLGLILATVLVFLILYMEIKSRRRRNSAKQYRTKTVTNIVNSTSQTTKENEYGNTMQITGNAPIGKLHKNTTRKSKHEEHVTKSLQPWQQSNLSKFGFKKLSESDCEVSPGYLEKTKSYTFSDSKTEVREKIKNYENGVQKKNDMSTHQPNVLNHEGYAISPELNNESKEKYIKTNIEGGVTRPLKSADWLLTESKPTRPPKSPRLGVNRVERTSITREEGITRQEKTLTSTDNLVTRAHTNRPESFSKPPKSPVHIKMGVGRLGSTPKNTIQGTTSKSLTSTNRAECPVRPPNSPLNVDRGMNRPPRSPINIKQSDTDQLKSPISTEQDITRPPISPTYIKVTREIVDVPDTKKILPKSPMLPKKHTLLQ